jgi:spermidine synthase
MKSIVMNTLNKIKSYIFPITVLKTESPFNPVLEVMLINGNYTLNSEHTNYSHGSLYSVFEKLFQKLNLDWEKVHDVLILGYGAGSIAEIIVQHKPDCKITGVEIDAKVIEISEQYFKLKEFKNVNVYCSSAQEYMASCMDSFDLIIIDLFIDQLVPREAETEAFLQQVKQALKPGGRVIFNKVTYTKAINDESPIVTERYKNVFGNLDMITIMNTGKIFISQKEDTYHHFLNESN